MAVQDQLKKPKSKRGPEGHWSTKTKQVDFRGPHSTNTSI